VDVMSQEIKEYLENKPNGGVEVTTSEIGESIGLETNHFTLCQGTF